MVTDIHLKLNVNAINKKHLSLKITLENNSSKDYFFNKKILLMDGAIGGKIILTGPSEIDCIGPALYRSTKFLLKHDEYIENTVSLNMICNFRKAETGIYNIKYTTFITPCSSDSVCELPHQIVGETSFQLGAPD